MFTKLYNLFKVNPYGELSTVAQILNAILQTFGPEKFVNGETDRDAAIDALILQLQTHKSTHISL